MAFSSAGCSADASGIPALTRCRNTYSVSPSDLRSSLAASGLTPSFSSRLTSAGVGFPAASKPTLAGISFLVSERAAEFASTAGIRTARRRGVAKSRYSTVLATKPAATSSSKSAEAKLSPSLFSAFGGSSSVKSSTSRLSFMLAPGPTSPLSVRQYSYPVAPAPPARTSGSPGAGENRNKTVTPRARGCVCGRCRRRAR